MRRLVAAAVATSIAAAVGLMVTPNAQATVSNATITPAVWQPSEQAQTVVTFDASAAATGASGDKMSVEIGWGWVYQYAHASQTPQSYAATYTSGTYTCATIGVTFQSAGFASAPTTAGSVSCQVLASSAYVGNPGQQVRLYNTAANGFTFTANNTVTVTFPAGTITAPSVGPASDTWRIIDNSGGNGETVTTVVPGADGSIPTAAPGLIVIDIDGNGGTCTSTAVRGVQGSWASAPASSACTRDGYVLSGFNTKADGSGLMITAGGNLHLTGDNRLFAQWAAPAVPTAPRSVVATAGFNKVTVTWQAPADQGSGAITNYLVQTSPGGQVCITRQTDTDMRSCTFTSVTAGTAYTFTVQALNAAGWGATSAPSAAATPRNLRVVDYKRTTLSWLLGGGTKITVTVRAPGFAKGTPVTVWQKVEATGEWAKAKGALPKVGVDGSATATFTLPRATNGKPVSVRVSVGDDVSNSITAK